MCNKLLPWWLVLVLVLCHAGYARTEDSCEHLLKQLAAHQGGFVQCSTKHSVPVTLCLGCEEPYNEMVATYIELSKVKNCTDKYFDKDRINIVSTTQSILTGLWAKAYCDDCFSSNNSFTFDQLSIEFSDCLRTHKGQECIACSPVYIELNTFYRTLEKNSSGKVCYDLQDEMNRTRSQWSKELHCCHREMDMSLFVIFSVLFALIPFIFYCGLFALGKRRERNHGLLNEELGNSPSTSVATLPAAISTAPTLPEANTPAPSVVTKNKPKGFTDFDSDCSEEYETEKPLAHKMQDKTL